MKKSVLGLVIIAIIVVAAAAFYYTSIVTAGHFSNGNVSFEYSKSFSISQTPVGAENSNGYFVCALTSSSNKSAIVIYQIPLTTTKNTTTTNQTHTVTPTNNSTNVTTNNSTSLTNTTVVLSVDNLQAYLNQVSNRGGTTTKETNNGYTYYKSTNLKSALVDYNASSRTGGVTVINISETAIVKDGLSNFYVVELLTTDNSQDAVNAYNQIINTLRIIG